MPRDTVEPHRVEGALREGLEACSLLYPVACAANRSQLNRMFRTDLDFE